MHCPFCNAEDTRVIDSRLVEDGARVRRRRECADCSTRFTTYEESECFIPRIIKKDGRREAFSEIKLRAGLLKALEKRPVAFAAIDAAILNIKKNLRSLNGKEVESLYLGELVMQALKSLDHVAYVRFASIYRSFEDIDAFRETIKTLEDELNE
jgi:transcriptional repressor NrdR